MDLISKALYSFPILTSSPPLPNEERISLKNFYKYFRNLNSTLSSSNSSSTSETVQGPAGINYCPIL